MSADPFLAQQAVSAFLLSWWKALLILAPFAAWAWLLAGKLNKDARYFHLNPKMWNGIHLAAAAAALLVMLLMPLPGEWAFFLGWPLGVVMLLAPVLAYWYVRDRNVPEDRKFRLSAEGLGAKLAARRQARAAKQALIQFTDSTKKQRPIPLKDDPHFAAHMLAEDFLGPALAARCSRVELIFGSSGGTIIHTIDGVRIKRETIPADAAAQLIDYLKDIAGLDIADRRRRQQGQFTLRGPESGGESAITMIAAGSSTGQSVRIDFDRATRLHKPFDALGLLPQQIEQLRLYEQMHERHGVILLGAPPGQGLTTTAYSMLARHDAYTSNVKSLEREIQVSLLGVDQVQWDASNPDVDYAMNLQSILRRDPDIVLTGEVRDTETARVITDSGGSGMKGPLVYVQQPLGTITEQIRDWVKKVGDVKEAVKSLRAVMNERTLRCLCPNCRQAYTPTPEQIKKLNLPAKKVTQLYRASGKVQVKNRIEDCKVCGGTGYLGQTGAFEVMIVDDECRKLLSSGDLKAALAHARRNNMIYIQEAALAKVLAGETDIDEVVRVTTPRQNPPKSSTGGGSPPTPSPS